MAIQTLSLQISDNASQAAANIDRLTASLQKLQSAISGGAVGNLATQLQSLAHSSGFGQQLDRIAQAVEQTNRLLVNMTNIINTLSSAFTGLASSTAVGNAQMAAHAAGIQTAINGTTSAVNALAGAMSSIKGATRSSGAAMQSYKGIVDNTNLGLQQMVNDLKGVGPAAGGLNDIVQTLWSMGTAATIGTNGIDDMDAAMKDSTWTVFDLESGLKLLKDQLSGVAERVGGLLSSFARIARMRLFRYIIRQVTSAFKEGLENVRAYSKAINGLYDKDMTQLDNAMLKLKNSLGAAIAPAIQAVLPLIHTLSSYLIQAANAFNQFMALMSGRSQWTKAIDVVASDFEKTKKSATGAAKAAKNLLASWDELNIIQSQAAGGGSGSGTKADIDYTKMFMEEFTFDNNIVKFVNFLKENLPIVNGALAGLLAFLLGIKLIGVTAIVGLVVELSSAEDIIKNGLTEQNLMSALIGAFTMMAAGGMIGWKTGGIGGLFLGALIGFEVALEITLFADYIHALSVNDIEKIIIDALGLVTATTALGATIGATTGNLPLGAITGLAVGLLISLIAYFAVDRKATDEMIYVSNEELQRIVNTHMFTIDVEATVNKINTTIGSAASARKDISSSLANVDLYFGLIELGIRDKETYQNLYDSLFTADTGLIARINKAIEVEKEVVRLSFKMVPVGDAQSLITTGITGWEGVETYVSGVGEELSHLLTKGIETGLDKDEAALVNALMTTISNVATITAQADARRTAESNLMRNLRSSDMTVAEAINAYYDELEGSLYDLELAGVYDREALAAIYNEMAAGETNLYNLALEQGKEEEAARHLALSEQYAASATEFATQASDLRAELEAGTTRSNTLYESTANGRELFMRDVFEMQNDVYASSFEETVRLARDLDQLVEQLYGKDIAGTARRMGIDTIDLLTPEQQRIWNLYQAGGSGQMLPAFGANLQSLLPESFVQGILSFIASPPTLDNAENVEVDAKNGTVSVDANVVSVTTSNPLADPENANRYKEYRDHYAVGGSGEKTDVTEQVVLERQMVDLLRQLLNKNPTVQLSPSASLGRVVAQAKSMWDRASGTAGG